ncbi:MAG: hypothetical protein ACK44E_02870 [Anaerolineales bacterium]
MKKPKRTIAKRRLPPPPPNQIPASQVRKFQLNSVEDLLQSARQAPFHGCWVMDGWQDEGMTSVVVSRILPRGEYLVGVFLVDLYCLGVKDCGVRLVSNPRAVERAIQQALLGKPVRCSIELAHEIIYGAVEFAAKYELKPCQDFEKCQLLLDPPDAHPRTQGVKFGKDGTPFYISGPNDDFYKSRAVINTLMRTAGEGNFHYLVALQNDALWDEFSKARSDSQMGS